MTQRNVEIVRRVVDSFNRRDLVAFAELCVPEVEIVPLRAAIEETVYRGPDSVSRFFADADEAWEGLRIDATEIRDLGENVLCLAAFHARGRTSGAILEARLGWILHLRDGLITKVHTYPSADEALEAAGLFE